MIRVLLIILASIICECAFAQLTVQIPALDSIRSAKVIGEDTLTIYALDRKGHPVKQMIITQDGQIDQQATNGLIRNQSIVTKPNLIGGPLTTTAGQTIIDEQTYQQIERIHTDLQTLRRNRVGGRRMSGARYDSLYRMIIHDILNTKQ